MGSPHVKSFSVNFAVVDGVHSLLHVSLSPVNTVFRNKPSANCMVPRGKLTKGKFKLKMLFIYIVLVGGQRIRGDNLSC